MKKIIAIAGFLGLFVTQAATSSAAYFNTAPLIRCDSQITNTLRIGSENDEVYTLQEMLVNAGFLNANPNGYFGYQTASAVQFFQINNGIPATGEVGEITRGVINSTLCGGNTYNTSSYNMYGANSGITYVGQADPFVTVVTPPSSAPAVYATPQDISYPTVPALNQNTFSNVSYANLPPVSVPSSVKIASTNIIYNPQTGYTYNIVPQSGSVTVSSPVANTYYKEGDTVLVNWTTNNIDANVFSILLESTISGQSRTVATVSGNSYSFVLTKELLDSVCAGICNNNQQGSFRVVLATPTTDLAGNVSTLRAAVAPITIKRQPTVGTFVISTSKTPVNSDEAFSLYLSTPSANVWGNDAIDPNSIVTIHALCINNVQVSIAGVPCGQDFVMPLSTVTSISGIPVKMTNTTWFQQNVTLEASIKDSFGQLLGTARTNVNVNKAPFSW